MSGGGPVQRVVERLRSGNRQRSVVIYRDDAGELGFVIAEQPSRFAAEAGMDVLDVVEIPDHVDHEVYFALGQAKQYEEGSDDALSFQQRRDTE